MKIIVHWKGIEYHSLEECTISKTQRSNEISSIIKGNYDKDVFRVKYAIKTNSNWEMTSCEINSEINNTTYSCLLNKDADDNWQLNNEPLAGAGNCFDADITLTPFTNSLPINRLQLQENEPCEISVIYFDILAHDVRIVRQQYERLSPTIIHFQNVPNDFEADIETDEDGLVVNYPGLFRRCDG